VPNLPRLLRERIGGLTWSTRVDQPPTWWRTVLADPESSLRHPPWHLKDSRNVTLARIPPPDSGQSGLVLRRLNYGRWRARFRDLFRPSRAQRAFRVALVLEAAGLPVARALAVADRRWWRWPQHAYLVSDQIEKAQTLAQVAHGRVAWPRSLVRAVAVLLAHLHESGFIHGDLKASNILIKTDTGDPWLIDFDGVRRFNRVPRARAASDLARLLTGIIEAGGNGSALLAIRFLRIYSIGRRLDDWRVLWRQVTKRVARALRESRRTNPNRP
jgi:tRNA A-37 threonylcarbamoyl transferase component Bud32